MRNFLIALAIVLMFPLAAIASPFLVCDPQAGVLEYEVIIEENGIREWYFHCKGESRELVGLE